MDELLWKEFNDFRSNFEHEIENLKRKIGHIEMNVAGNTKTVLQISNSFTKICVKTEQIKGDETNRKR